MSFRYRVRTDCTATVTEEWTLTSPRSLTKEEVEEQFFNDDAEAPRSFEVTVERVSQTISGDEPVDRELLDILDLDATRYVAPVPPCVHPDDGTTLEYKMHLDQWVCRCGARREATDRGHGTDWTRTADARDQRA